MKSAHSLDNYFDGVVVQNNIEVLNKFIFVRVSGKISEIEDIFELKVFLGAFAYDTVVVFVKHFHNARTDGSVTHNGYIHFFSHPK